MTQLEAVVGGKLAVAVKSFEAAKIAKHMEFILRTGIKVVGFWEQDYPEQLRQISDAPPLLFVMGDVSVLSRPSVAVVGTRRPTAYGRRVAQELARALANANVVLVSGGARGVDSVGHKACVEAGGKTIVVLGSGHARLYPRENTRFFLEIAKGSGAVISEFLPFTSPDPGLFPRRNRIISGLAKTVIVVEGDMGSGALNTASWAADQSRDVYAVPGPIYSAKSRGTNWLISQGAMVYTGPESIVDEARPVQLPEMNQAEKTVFDALSHEPIHLDQISEMTHMDTPTALSVLLSLEIKGAVSQLPGKFFVRAL